VEVFDSNSFVVAASGDMEIDAENGADFFKKAFESTAVVNNNETAEADFEEDVLDEETGEVVRSGVVSGSDENKSGEVTHGVHEVCLAAVVGNIARSPEIDIEDVERAAEGPGKDELAVAGDGAVGGNAVRALKDPIGDIFAAEGPEEAEANAVQSFVNTHVTGRGGCVIGREDVTAKRQRNDDEHEHLLVVLDGLEDDELAFKQG
jgi:hypothetical protein